MNKTIKIILTSLLVLILLITQLATMMLFTITQITSKSKIKQLIEQSNIVDYTIEKTIDFVEKEVENHIIEKDHAQVIKDVLNNSQFSDTARQYLSDVVIEVLDKKQLPQLTTQDIKEAFDTGIEQVESYTNIEISKEQKQQIENFLDSNSKKFVKVINENIKVNTQNQISPELEKYLSIIFNPTLKFFAISIFLVAGVVIILLLWKSKKGFLLCGIISFISTFIFVLGGLIVGSLTSAILQRFEIDLSYLSNVIINTTLLIGTLFALLGLILIIIYIINKRKKSNLKGA